MAKTTGFEMNELLGVIATVSEVTQNSASTIGNSVKTLLSRMSNVKAGVEIDPESGEALNDVEKVLNRVGIALRDNQGNWYDFYDVLDEIANKWEEFSDIQQSQITTALGGTRQRENVLVMLENWDKVKQYAETGANSAGTAMDKYGIVLESVSAKQEQLTAKTQEFQSNILSGGFISGILDIGKALMDFINLGDGLIGKLSLLVVGTVAWIAVLESLKKSGITSFTALIAKILGVNVAQITATGSAVGLKAVWDILSAHPIMLAITAITTALTIGKLAWDKYQESIQETINKANELTEAYKSTNQELQDNINSLTSAGSGSYATLASEFEALCKGVDEYGNNISLTSDQYERYKSICQQIVGLNPKLLDGYDSETEAIGNKNNLLQATIELLKEEQRLKAQEYADTSGEVLEGAQNKHTQDKMDLGRSPIQPKDSGKVAKLLKENIKKTNKIGESFTADDYDIFSILGLTEYWSDYSTSTNKVTDLISDHYDEVISALQNGRAELTESYKGATDELTYDMILDSDSVNEIFTFLNTEVEDYNAKSQTIADNFADSMNTIYQATARSTIGYSELSNESKKFIESFYDSNFNVDENTTKEIIDKNKETIGNIVRAMSENSNIADSMAEFYKFGIDDFVKEEDYNTKANEIATNISNAFDKAGVKIDVAEIKNALDSIFDIEGLREKEANITGLIDKLTNAKGFDKGKKSIEEWVNALDAQQIDRARLVVQQFSDEAGNLDTAIINSIDTLEAYMEQYNKIDSALNNVSEGFDKATQAKNKFEASIKGITEYDDNFSSYTSAIEMLEKEFENGTVGSKTFAEACKYLFGEGFDTTNVDEAYKQLQNLKNVFAEDTYGEGMLKQIQKLKKAGEDLGETFAKQNSDGTWDFDIDTSKEGIEKLAKALGTTEEGVWSCISAMQMLGGVDLFDSDAIYDFASAFGELGFITNETGEAIQTIDVDGLRQKLEDAGISTVNLDEALKTLQDKGVILLDVSAEAEVLKNSLSDLGLIAQDGEVNVGNLVSTLTSMGYSNDQIITALSSLSELTGLNFTNLSQGVSTVQGEIDLLKNSSDTSGDSLETMKAKAEQLDQVTLTTIQGAIDGVNSKLSNANITCGTLITNLNRIDGTHTVTINYVETNKPTGTGGLHGIGNGIHHRGKAYIKGSAFSYGNLGAKRDITALTGEIEPEIWVHADTGEWELITNPQFVRVKKGDIIFNGQQTKDLLRKGASANFGTSFVKGTAFVSGSSWGKWKKKYNISSGSGSGSGSGKSSSSSSGKSSSSSSSKEWWEEDLESLKDSLDYNNIAMAVYIEGLEQLLSQVSKGTEAWDKINKELQDVKLDNTKNQFNRGEITITQYISKLEELRKAYSSNSEGYKELTKTINETKADKFLDQYKRGQISLEDYTKELTNLRNGYKQNSEEWKKYNDLIKDSKLDDIEKQFEYNKITIDEYIQKLEELSKTYNKNSEDYKELAQTINDTKYDKFSSQYERGEITANQYISKLKSLQNQYKQGSEEYKKLADEIDKIELEKTEKFLDKLQGKLDKLDQKINEMGEVNTDKEKVKYALLLSERYKEVQSNVSSIQKELKKTNLTEEQREILQSKLNDLLIEEVDIRDEIEDQVKTYFENQKEEAEKQAELAKKQALYNKELELYGERGKEFFERATNKKIEAINDEIEAREKEKESLDKINEREQLSNDLLEAKLNLQNALNSKTTKILKKQEDGTWQYEYSVNMADVKEAQEAVSEAEKALEDYDWEQSIDKLRDEASKLQDSMDNLAEQYEDEEFFENTKYEKTINSIEKTYGDIESLVEDWLKTNGKNTDKLINSYLDLVESNNALEDNINSLNTDIKAEYESANYTSDIANSVMDIIKLVIPKINNFPELLSVTKFTAGSTNKIGSVAGKGVSTQNVISKVECVFPNITSTDGLQQAILALPRLALQKK